MTFFYSRKKYSDRVVSDGRTARRNCENKRITLLRSSGVHVKLLPRYSLYRMIRFYIEVQICQQDIQYSTGFLANPRMRGTVSYRNANRLLKSRGKKK